MENAINAAESLPLPIKPQSLSSSWLTDYDFESYSLADSYIPVAIPQENKNQKQVHRLEYPPNSRLTKHHHLIYLAKENGVMDKALQERFHFESLCYRTWIKAVCSMNRSIYLECKIAQKFIESLVKNRNDNIKSQFSRIKKISFKMLHSGSLFLEFEKTLLGTGHGKPINLSTINLNQISSKEPLMRKLGLKSDKHIPEMAKCISPDVCITESSLKALFSSAHDTSSCFDIPFEITEREYQKTVIFEKPLPSNEWSPRKMLQKYYKKLIRTLNDGNEPEVSSMEYNLWKLGDLKIVIRSNVWIRSSKRASFSAKIEYNGPEEMTPMEHAHFWLSSFLNGRVPVVTARVNAIENKLVGIEEVPFDLLTGDGSWIKKSTHALFLVLKECTMLEPGNYHLQKCTNNDDIFILKPSTSGIELRKPFTIVGNITKFEYQPITWRRSINQVPYTFPPLEDESEFKQPPKLEFCSALCVNDKCLNKVHVLDEERDVLIHAWSPFYIERNHFKSSINYKDRVSKKPWSLVEKPEYWVDADAIQNDNVMLEY